MSKIMKRRLFIMLYSLFCICSNSFSQQIDWASQVLPFSNWNAGNHINSDYNGNVYVTGLYNGSSIGSNPTGSFILKYDSTGSLIWTQNIQGALSYGGYTDSLGNTYITGRFGGAVNFGGHTVHGSGWNFFLAKYNCQGICLWVQEAGQALGKALKADNKGNVIVTGNFGGSCTFGTSTITQTNSGIHDNFIVKYNSLGQCLWVRQTIGSAYGNGGDLTIDNKENIYITDNYILPITFQSDSNSVTLTTQGGSIYMAKYNGDGRFEWAKQIGDSSNCQSRGIACDASGNTYVSGWYGHKIYFENTLITCITENGFLTKYNADGILQWVRQPLNQTGKGFGVSVSKVNDIYLTGNFENAGIYSNIIKYDSLGNEKWLQGYTTINAGHVISYGISINVRGNIYITGEFEGAIQFGNSTLNKAFNGPDMDAFLVKSFDEDVQANSFDHAETYSTLTVYPNPTGDILYINYNNTDALQKIEINVKNVLGQIVYFTSSSLNTGQYTLAINLNQENRGIYFIEVIAGNKRSVKKIILN